MPERRGGFLAPAFRCLAAVLVVTSSSLAAVAPAAAVPGASVPGASVPGASVPGAPEPGGRAGGAALVPVAAALEQASAAVREAELIVRTKRAGRVCPVGGPVAFYDDFGNARSGGRRHAGNDLISTHGTPNVAVVAGRVEFKSGSRQGRGAYLRGDDGNEYWYFHLAAYAGAPRRVVQGEVIGLTGDTGNAGGDHTHFEIHPGADPDEVVNPYPLLDFVCIDRTPL
jgi:murein DD-endopeptidase MepM/ murein hydrolase activator NlpD